MRNYQTLEQFVSESTPDIDMLMSDGAGKSFHVKGKQIEAAVVFIDMGRFTARTLGIPPAATLILVNKFLNWIIEEGLRDKPGIIDKYIGDELMIVFAKEFGSEDPFFDAVQCAVAMSEYDPWGFSPHSGVAFGKVIVGQVGNDLSKSFSVFGDAVTIASRLAGFNDPSLNSRPEVVFATEHWGDRETLKVFGAYDELWEFKSWMAGSSNTKGLPDTEVCLLSRNITHTFLLTNSLESTTVEEVVIQELQELVDNRKASQSLLSK